MPTNGTFSENPKTEWLTEPGDNRNMKLIADFWFDDPDGRRWLAPAGSIVNGASIPASLWSLVGAPYVGNYRRASIVHDVACEDPSVSRKEADRMFYYACRAGGCSLWQARRLYAGVRIGAWTSGIGLREEKMLGRPAPALGAASHSATDATIRTTFDGIAAELETQPEDLSIDEMDAIIDRHLPAETPSQ